MVSSATAHATAVHFPIALLAFAGVHGAWSRWRGEAPSVAVTLAGAAGAVVAVATGWILAGDVEDALLERHRWLGITTAGLAIVSVLATRARRRDLALLPVGLAAISALSTGWLGGEMAHGSGGGPSIAALAAAPMPRIRSQRQIELPGDASDEVIAVEAHRLLKRSCLKCHRATKKKGGLRLDTRADALAGGESGPAVIPGDQASLILARVKLDDADEDIMPRRGKLLSPSEIELLSRWIARGAPWPAD